MLATLMLLHAFLFSPPLLFQDQPVYDPVGDYERQCPNRNEETLDCIFLRALVRQAVVESLETIEYSRDQRGAEEALAAIELDDEPEIQVAACRILGHFPELTGLRNRLPQLLFSPYPAVQEMAARAMSANRDSELSELGRQWLDNHRASRDRDPYEESPVPTQPAQLGIADYPGSVRFPPAESKISYAWMTADPPAKAIDFHARKSGKRALDARAWEARQEADLERQQAAFGDYLNRPELEEIQKLVEQYMTTQDPKILEKIEVLQKRLETVSQGMQQDMEDPVTQAALRLDSNAMENARYLILEERAGKPTQLLIAYPDSFFGKTVIRLIWDGDLYGHAWE